MTAAFKCRFLDHTLAAVEHGEVRFYEGTIVSFQRSVISGEGVSPRSINDLHTIVTFKTDHSSNSSHGCSAGGAGDDDPLTVIFCFHESWDVGIVCSTAHEVSVITKIATEAKSSPKGSISSSGGAGDGGGGAAFVHLKYGAVEDVSPFVRFQGSPHQHQSGGERLPLPFPHTRLDFLRLANNRSVQCKLSSLGDSRIELSCDGVSVRGSLCGEDGQHSLSLRQSRQILADQQMTTAQLQQESTGSAAAASSSSTSKPTKVVILSDMALYVTDNNGRVCGRVALADITELVHMPEASALFVIAAEASSSLSSLSSSSSSIVGGSLLVSRFCPDIFTRMSMSGRLVRCLPPQTSMSELQHIAAVGVGMGIGGSAPAASGRYPLPSSAALALSDVLAATLAETPQHLLRIAKEEQEVRERHERLLLTSRPTMCDFAAQTGGEHDDDDDDESGSPHKHRLLSATAKDDAGSPSFGSSGKNCAAETLYWMNQAERLQAALSRRDLALRLAHERYEALANSFSAAAKAKKQQQPLPPSRTDRPSGQQHHQVTMEVQRELEVLRHYSRLLEEEVVEATESQLQQRVLELSKELMSVKQQNEQGGAHNAGDTVQVMRTALRDSQRHQAMITRKCDRLQSELQSVMLNTDSALSELTGFVATIVQQQHGVASGISGGNVLDVSALVQDIVAQLHNINSKVESEAAVKVAELKALNAALVLELRAREQELDSMAAEMVGSSASRRRDTASSSAVGPSRVFADTVAQNAAESKHRAMARRVADLQQVRDRLVEELQHIFEGANAQKQLRSLQERVSLLERMHQFPLLINRTASLEAVAAQCEAAKLQAKAMKQELDDKTAQLARRGTANSSLQSDMEALRKKAVQLEQIANKEMTRREDVEKKASDAAAAHQNEVKELRKQVRYHQVRVQELLKRVSSGNADHEREGRKENIVLSGAAADSLSATANTLRRAASPAAVSATVSEASAMRPATASSTTIASSRGEAARAASSTTLRKLDSNRASTPLAPANSSVATAKKKSTSSAPTLATGGKPASASTSPAAKQSSFQTAAATATDASPEVFGVVEDPAWLVASKSRFGQIASARTKTPPFRK